MHRADADGDTTLPIHVGTEMTAFAKDDALPDPSGTSHPELKCVLQLFENRIYLAATWMRMVKALQGCR